MVTVVVVVVLADQYGVYVGAGAAVCGTRYIPPFYPLALFRVRFAPRTKTTDLLTETLKSQCGQRN